MNTVTITLIGLASIIGSIIGYWKINNDLDGVIYGQIIVLAVVILLKEHVIGLTGLIV